MGKLILRTKYEEKQKLRKPTLHEIHNSHIYNPLEKRQKERKTRLRAIIDAHGNLIYTDDKKVQKLYMDGDRTGISFDNAITLKFRRALLDGTFMEFYVSNTPNRIINVLATSIEHDYPEIEVPLKELDLAMRFGNWCRDLGCLCCGRIACKSECSSAVIQELNSIMLRGNVLCKRVDEDGDEFDVQKKHMIELSKTSIVEYTAGYKIKKDRKRNPSIIR